LEYYGKTQYYLDVLKMDEFEKNKMTTQLTDKKNELHDLNKEMNALEDKLDEISSEDEFHLDRVEIENSLDVKRSEGKGLVEEIRQIESQLESPYSQSEQILNQLLGELGQNQTGIISKIAELRANLEAATGQDSIHNITASQAGELHYLMPLAEGMAIQQNQILGEVAQPDHDFYIDAYIAAADRSNGK